MSTSKTFVGHCQKCHAPIGELSQEELDFVVFTSRSKLVCFFCDDGSADYFPEFFWKWEESTVFMLGDESFVLNWSANGSPRFSRARAHDAPAGVACLVSTYLNRNNEKKGVLFDLQEYGECPECDGLGWTNGRIKQLQCEYCNGDGEIVKAVFLPLWLISGSVVSA